MKWRGWFSLSSGTLLKRLMIGYAAVICLLLFFHFLTIYSLKGRFEEKLIGYNELNLHNTVGNYEDLLLATKNIMLGLYQNQFIAYLHSESVSAASDISQTNVQAIHTLLRETFQANPHLYLENLYVHVRDPSVVISKEGISDASLLFDKYMEGEFATTSFWTSQFHEDELFQVVPTKLIGFSEQKTIGKDTLALIVKNRFMPDLYFVAFINTDKAFQSLHHSFNGDFWIKDSNDRYYTSFGQEPSLPILWNGQEPFAYYGDSYYLFNRGAFSGLTYINRIPEDTIQTELNNLYAVFIPILFAALIFSMIVSILYSLSINHPVKRFMEALHHYRWNEIKPSGIEEFRRIREHLTDMAGKKQRADQDLYESRSLLKNYAYVNKLKAIKTNFPSLMSTDFESAPYLFLVFQLHFRRPTEQVPELEPV